MNSVVNILASSQMTFQLKAECQEIWTTNTDTNTDNTDIYTNTNKHRHIQKHHTSHGDKDGQQACAIAAVLKIKLNRRKGNLCRMVTCNLTYGPRGDANGTKRVTQFLPKHRWGLH